MPSSGNGEMLRRSALESGYGIVCKNGEALARWGTAEGGEGNTGLGGETPASMMVEGRRPQVPGKAH